MVLYVLHCVIDCESGGNGTTGGIDVELDVLLRVFGREEKHLGNDEVGDLIVDRRSKEDDVVAQQTGIDIVGALASVRLLNDHWYQCHALLLTSRSRAPSIHRAEPGRSVSQVHFDP